MNGNNTRLNFPIENLRIIADHLFVHFAIECQEIPIHLLELNACFRSLSDCRVERCWMKEALGQMENKKARVNKYALEILKKRG